MSRLDKTGFLTYEAQEKGLSLWETISQIVDGNSELEMYLLIETTEKVLRELPGARELLETMIMY